MCRTDNDAALCCEHISACLDDLTIASKSLESAIDLISSRHGFNLKGVGPTSFHIGCDFVHNGNAELCIAPRDYTQKLVNPCTTIFGCKP